jgi:hypothetical protein
MLISVHHKIDCEVDGKPRQLTVEEYGRGGTKSPEMWVIVCDGKRYVPRAQRLARITVTLNGLFKIVYAPAGLFKDLVYKTNPFMEMIPKNETWGGKYIRLPDAD